MMRAACIGECMMELFEHSDGRLSRAYGGDTLNTAVYMARVGLAVDYVTALGTDPFSDEMIAGWAAEGVGTGLVQRVAETLPGLYMIQTDAVGERRFSYWRDSAPVRRMLTGDAADSVAAGLRHDLIYLSGITLSLFGAEGRARLFDILADARRAGSRVAFDTNFRPRGWPLRAEAQDAYRRMMAQSDIVLAGVEDHALLHGGGDMRAWARAEEVVIKLVVPGCIVLCDGQEIEVTAPAVANVLDTTAAGDSFAAAYLAARATGASPRDAANAGHRLAGAVIRHRGAIIPRDAMPT